MNKFSKLSPAKRALLEKRLQGRLKEKKPENRPIPPRGTDKPAPLSFGQQRLWFVEQLDELSAGYNIVEANLFEGDINIDYFERSINEIVRRHEALRMVIEVIDEEPVQVIIPRYEYKIEVQDKQHLSWEEQYALIRQLARDERSCVFDLSTGPLMRLHFFKLAPQKHVLVANMHHIISDGWSMGVFVNEFAHFYTALKENKPFRMPELPIQYSDFAQWQRQWFSGDIYKKQLDYWMKKLAGMPTVVELPHDYPRPGVQSFSGMEKKVILSAELKEGLEKLSQELNVTLYMTLLTAFVIFLSRYTGEEDIVTGCPIANRNRVEIEPLIGFFANTMVMRSDASGNPRFSELVQRVRETTLGAYANQDMPFEKLVEELDPVRSLQHSPLFQNQFILENALQDQIVELPGLTISTIETEVTSSIHDLTVYLEEVDRELSMMFEFNTDLFQPSTIESLMKEFYQLLEAVKENPHLRLSQYPILTAETREQIENRWSRGPEGERFDPPEKILHHRFQQQAEKTPEAAALVFQGETVTYGQLNRRANRLAHYLVSRGVTPGSRVGICMERSAEMIAGIFGILKAGGAYVPIDPGCPAERIRYILEDARITHVAVHQSTRGLIAEAAEKLPEAAAICLDSDADAVDKQAAVNPHLPADPQDLAYVIYTSGTSGQPKGVLISHQNVSLSTASRMAYYKEAPSAFLLLPPLSFDGSVTGIFWTLLYGGTLVIPPEDFHREIETISRLIEDRRVSHFMSVPSLYTLMLEHLEKSRVPQLKTVITAGETCTPELVKKHMTRLPGTALFNEYGPTEGTVWCTVYRCRETEERKIVPIGRPHANSRIYIIDKYGNLVPPLVTGELHIGGPCLASGYLHRPELTAEAFIPDPFSSEPGARLYKTGDLARFRRDGHIEFMGRSDFQVKVRGYRIELAEIESVLVLHRRVKEAAAAAEKSETGDNRLVAYIVTDSAEDLPGNELIRHLKTRLPEYMIPSAFKIVEEIPLTPGGKVNREALTAVSAPSAAVGTGFAAPRTPMEETLCSIIKDVLDIEKVGIYDNFFEVGGHSLLATRVISRIKQQYAVSFQLKDFFTDPTIAALAQVVEKAVAGKSTGISLCDTIEPAPLSQYYELSHPQKRIWIACAVTEGSAAYNMPEAYILKGPLETEAFARAFDALIRRHESLRTVFISVEDEVRQKIAAPEDIGFKLNTADISGETQKEAKIEALAGESASAPFDLVNGPLLRAALVRLAEKENLFLFTLHHIVGDGWSMRVMVEEVLTLYHAFKQDKENPLPPLELQYKDYSAWINKQLQGEEAAKLRDYWLDQLSGRLPVLELPTDKKRPEVRSYRGASFDFVFDEDLANRFNRLCRKQEATLFMGLTAAINALLHGYTGQTDIIIGSPIAGREHQALENQVGIFINTLALRTRFAGQDTFLQLLAKVKENTLGAYEHQQYPFDLLVEDLKLIPDMSRSMLFDVMVALQNVDIGKGRTDGNSEFSVEVLPNAHPVALFDLTLTFSQAGEQLRLNITYSTDLFLETSIEIFCRKLEKLLRGILAAPGASLKEYDIRLEEETQLEEVDTGVSFDF